MILGMTAAVATALLMELIAHSFTFPNCQALYQVVKVEAGPETVSREITCRVCGGPLAGREGKFVLKYFFLREAIRRKGDTAKAD